jgi:hypothetical protein
VTPFRSSGHLRTHQTALGTGLLALAGIAECLCGVGDDVLVEGLEGGQALEEVDLAAGLRGGR